MGRLAATAMLLAACASPDAADRAGDPASTVVALVDADRRRDLDAALACYADDVVWLPPGAAPVEGKPAVAARYRSMFDAYDPQLAVEVAESRAAGDLAFVRGTTRGELLPRGQGDRVAVLDTFVALLRRSAAGWRITHLMWHAAPAR